MNTKLYALIAVFLFTFLFSSTDSFSQWQRVKNLPAGFSENDGAYYLDVYFLPYDSNYGWACGYDGKIVYTTDAGKNWRSTKINTAKQMESIFFVNKDVGFAVDATQSAIYKSTTGGRTWTNITPGYTQNGGYSEILELWGTYFYDENFGVMLGGSSCYANQLSYFYRTTDGGNSWQRTYENPIGRPTKLCDAIILDKNGSSYAISSGLLWESDDALNWRIIDETGGYDWHEEITYEKGSFLVPVSQGCAGSMDNGRGGMRFKEASSNYWRPFTTNYPMFGTCLLDSLTGWAVGINRSVYFTSDAGKNWELKNCGILAEADLDDIYFANDTTGWLVGKGIYKWSPVDTTKLKYIAKNPVCPDEKGYIKVIEPENYEKLDWYIDGKFYTSFYDSISVLPGKRVKIVYEDWDKPNCGQVDSIIITIYPRSELSIYKEDSLKLCKNDSLLLICEQDFPNYFWSNGDTTKSTTVYKAGDYTLTIIDTNGCQFAKTVKVKEVPSPEASIEIIGNNVICFKDSVILKLNGNYTNCSWYKDTKSSGNFISNNKEIKVNKEGIYFALIENDNNCENYSDTVFIKVNADSNRFEYRFSNTDYVENMPNSIFPQIICRNLKIYNITNFTQTLDYAFFRDNISFSVPPGQLPIAINAWDNIDLNVCYTAHKLTKEIDTLIIPDRCNYHRVPITAEVEADDFTGETRCSIYITTSPKSIDNSFVAYFSAPYPNPVFSDIYIDVIGTIEQIELANIEITDYLGNRMPFDRSLVDIGINGATIKINCELQNGMYFIRISYKNTYTVYPIIIIK